MIREHMDHDSEANRDALAHNMDFSCPEDVIEHIAAIEAGWTLPKPWKVEDVERAEAENVEAIREMVERWKQHGITLTTPV